MAGRAVRKQPPHQIPFWPGRCPCLSCSRNRLQQKRPRRSHLKGHLDPPLMPYFFRNGAGIVTRPRVENFTR